VSAQAALLGPLVAFRFVDGDEGVYAYAARLVRHGHLPYRDFFYEQMPLLPYVYGGWTAVAGESWYSVRALSALLAAAGGAVLYLHVLRRHGSRPLACVALWLYALSALVLDYFPIVKTFALASLLLLGALVLVEERTHPSWLLAGLLTGLAVDTRLVFAATIPAFAFAARRRLARYSAGLAIGLVPSVVFLALAPHQFVFDSLRYHGEKTTHGLVGDPGQKLRTAANLLGYGDTDRALGLQLALLLAATALALWLLRRRLPLAAAVGALLGVACLLPTPTYVQYFSVVVPFLVLVVVDAIAFARSRARAAAVAILLAGYGVAAGFAYAHDLETSPILRPSVASVRKVQTVVQRESTPGERVLSSWPGYLFGTHAEAWPGYTNQFAPAAAAHVSPAEARRVHVASEAQLEAAIRARAPRLVVYRNWITTAPFAQWDEALRAGGYALVAEVETAKVYRR
jgi:dolichyl-phosphate-mannose-protein mannosyltransferase